MFTGIVNGIASIVSIEKKKQFHRYTTKLSPDLSKDLTIGASVSHNGCCLTVKSINHGYAVFDVISETLKKTNLGTLNVGDDVNIERSVKYGDELGGHIISGHIIDTAEVSKVLNLNNDYIFWLKMNKKSLMKYIFYKGFICVDGISLTINEIFNNEFCVNLIPETLLSTTIGKKKNGSLMNIEIDFYTQIIVDTTNRLINKKIILK